MEDRHVSSNGPKFRSFHTLIISPCFELYPFPPVRRPSPARPHSHLNLIRSVTAILEIMDEAIKEQHDRPPSQQRSFSRASLSSEDRGHSDETARDPEFCLSEKHKLLRLRLKPLSSIQRDLEEYLDSALEPDEVGAAFHTAFPSSDTESSRGPPRFTGFPTSGINNSSRKTRFSARVPKWSTETKLAQDLHNTIEVLYCCGSDIKQLWEDDAVQQLLKAPRSSLEYSGL